MCYAWAANQESPSSFQLPPLLPWHNMGKGISLCIEATSLLEKHLPCEFISWIQNRSDAMQNITFTELVSKVAVKSHNNLDGLEYYTENSYKKPINPGINAMFLPFCMYVRS